MISRRDFARGAAAAAAIVGSARLGRLAAEEKLTQEHLLEFSPVGNVTLVHMTDIHAQLVPLYFREPTINIGVGDSRGLVPHITGRAFLDRFKLAADSPEAYALTDNDYVALAKAYGRMGGLDRMATVINAIRAARPDRTLLLDGGDTWTNSWTALKTRGQDMVDVVNLMKPDAMTAHWEFTLGAERLQEIVSGLPFKFLAQNVQDSEFNDPVFDGVATFERGGVKIAVIGQAFPFTSIANPRWMFPKWSFGIRPEDIQKRADEARAAGAGLVVLLSHNGFDLDRKLAGMLKGVDVILAGHTHDAVPEVTKVGDSLLVSSGSHGKFVSRLDLDVAGGRIRDFRYKLIPIFSDAIKPDAAVAAKIAEHRKPYAADLSKVVAKTDSLLYRRGNFAGTLDDIFCDAILAEREADIALSPGFRWGTTLLPGQNITFEDITNGCAISYPACYRMPMTGSRIKDILEDVADNLFNPDPFYQQGGDMVRTGGLSFTCDVAAGIGKRISDLRLIKTGQPLDPAREYVVAGWASIGEGVEGPPIWDVVVKYLERVKTVSARTTNTVSVKGV